MTTILIACLSCALEALVLIGTAPARPGRRSRPLALEGGLSQPLLEADLAESRLAGRYQRALAELGRRDARVRVLTFARNFGHQVAITAGLDHAAGDAVLRTFAEITGLNLVIDPEVKGIVDVSLHEVPWDHALDIILRAA